MTVTQIRKVRCDNCDKECEASPGACLPLGWFELNITEWHTNCGERRLQKDLCSEKCLMELMHKIEKLDPKKPARL